MKKQLVILYHTNLSGNPNAGLTYSIPKQIKIQSMTDNVLWINNANVKVREWMDTGVYHTKEELGFDTLDDLNTPFNKPDVVVFESFYHIKDAKLAKELRRKAIPYIIVPRGALTNGAQHLKRVKKLIGNMLIFNSFAKHAAGIQYLTEREKLDSGNKWNKYSFVIPNGIDVPLTKKRDFSEDKIILSFIGRIAIQHKGLDLLIDAINMSSNLLREHKCIFNIYGPDDSGSVDALSFKIHEQKLGDLINIHSAVHDKEKEHVLLNTDVFVLTSRFEGHPMGLIEALSYGVPVLVTTGTNMRDEIEKYNAGWTADNDVNSICSAFRRMIEEKIYVAEKSMNAIELANRYSWSIVAELSHRKYQDIIYECKK